MVGDANLSKIWGRSAEIRPEVYKGQEKEIQIAQKLRTYLLSVSIYRITCISFI